MNPWMPITDIRLCALLNKAGEELNELGKALNRALMQGLDGCDPKTGEVNREALLLEIADVRGLCSAIVEELDLNEARMDRRSDQKEANVFAWMNMIAPATGAKVDPANYDCWIAKGRELHRKYDGSAIGLQAWHGWSADAWNYEPAALDNIWPSFAQEPADG